MQQKEMVMGEGVWLINRQVTEVFQLETQTAVGKIKLRRQRPEVGPPMKEESLIFWVGTRRRRMSQKTLRSNQESMKDRIESHTIPRFIVWKDG